MRAELEDLSACSSGERPALGLLQGFPGDMDVFVRYLWAAATCHGCDVVDVGSGIGYGAFILARQARSVIGVDTDEESVRFSQETWGSGNPRLRFRSVNPSRLDVEDNSVDRVICFEVLEHVTEPEVMVGEFWRVLKPGGLLITSTPNPYLFPYAINSEGMVSESAENYRKRGIWAWHLSGLKPEDSLRIAITAGFSSNELLYTTYVGGFTHLSRIFEAENLDTALKTLDQSTHWQLDQFAVTSEFSPYFSGYSYIIVSQKSSTSPS